MKNIINIIPFLNQYPIWAQIIVVLCVVLIISILIFVPRETLPPPSEFPEIIIHGALPVRTIKQRPDMKLQDDLPIPEEQGLYFVLELSSKNQIVNVGSLEIEGRLYLNMREYAFYIEKNVRKKPLVLNKEIADKKPYLEIKWIAWPSRPGPSKLGTHDNKLFLFTLLEPTIDSPSRFFLTKDDAHEYIGYEKPEQKAKLESTHPNLVEFTETKIINNKAVIVGLRDDFKNGNIKYCLKIGDKKIFIEREKLKALKSEYFGQKDNIMQMPLDKIYYRKIY